MSFDLGIQNRRALVCGASRGLGRACATALVRAGADVIITARNAEGLIEAAAAIRTETGSAVRWIAGDIATEEGRSAALDAAGPIDILVTNAAGPPPGDFLDFTNEQWLSALRVNMLTPIALIQSTVGGMCDRGFGRIVNITSSSIKAPIPTLSLSTGARAGLTGAIASLARQVAPHNVAINNLLPGAFLTDRVRDIWGQRARSAGISLDEQMALEAEKLPTKRIGRPDEFGATCAFLCSAWAGYIVGQNILIDGGNFNGAFS